MIAGTVKLTVKILAVQVLILVLKKIIKFQNQLIDIAVLMFNYITYI